MSVLVLWDLTSLSSPAIQGVRAGNTLAASASKRSCRGIWCEPYLHVLIHHWAVISYPCVVGLGVELVFRDESLSFVLCVMYVVLHLYREPAATSIDCFIVGTYKYISLVLIHLIVFTLFNSFSSLCFLYGEEAGGVCKFVKANCSSLMRWMVTDGGRMLEG